MEKHLFPLMVAQIVTFLCKKRVQVAVVSLADDSGPMHLYQSVYIIGIVDGAPE